MCKMCCNEFAECSCHPAIDFSDAVSVRIRPVAPKDLNPDQMRRIGRLQFKLFELAPLLIRDWVYSFAIDADPEQAIRNHEVALRVYQQLAVVRELSLKNKRKLYGDLCLIANDHRCVDPQKDISAELPDFATIESMCRQARESYAVTSDA